MKYVVLSCKEFLCQRVGQDQKNILDRFNEFIDARIAKKVIQAARIGIENLFGKNAVSSFSDDVIGLYAADKLPPPSEINTSAAKLFHYLKIATRHSLFSKLLQSYRVRPKKGRKPYLRYL
jgi:hypothetical protein